MAALEINRLTTTVTLKTSRPAITGEGGTGQSASKSPSPEKCYYMAYVAAPEKLHSQGLSLCDVTQSQLCEQPYP